LHEAVYSKADLGRLDGLLKRYLSDPGDAEGWHDELRQLLKLIEVSQR
jgi:hypothetical protein